MKILHTEWSQGWGGQEIRILAESLAVTQRGHTVAIACRTDSQLYERARAAEIPVYPVAFKHTLDIGSVLTVKKIARREGFDLIHTHSSIDSWVGGFAGKLGGIPVVRSRHLTSPVKPRANNRYLYNKLPHSVITSGETIAQHLIKDLQTPERQVVSIPAGADHERFHPEVSTDGLAEDLGLKPSHTVVGIVAVLRSWKGHKVLLDAFARLAPNNDALRLLIVGDGPTREVLKERVAELKLEERVIFTGHRDDVPNLMKLMDVFVLPSLKNEATSQVLPQAMLVGIPCIASDAGGLPEIVRDGETGLLVSAGESEPLAEAIKKLCDDRELAQALASKAREKALEHLTFKTQIDRTLAVYEAALSR